MSVAKNSLEVHYYFRENDDGHLFDVRKRNRCEHALVQIIAEVARVLDVRVKVEALPPREGGFVERIVFSNRLRATAAWMPVVVSSVVELLALPAKADEAAKHAVVDALSAAVVRYRDAAALEVCRARLGELVSNIKIRKQKSNFFRCLNGYHKVVRVGFSFVNPEGAAVEGAQLMVEREGFSSHILLRDEVEPLVLENSSIQIIAPVLFDSDTYCWKGLFDDQGTQRIINFVMKDVAFKTQVAEQKIAFKTGTYLNCVLSIGRRVDAEGNVINTRYTVTLVSDYYDGAGAHIETKQGKEHRRKAKEEPAQMQLSFDF